MTDVMTFLQNMEQLSAQHQIIFFALIGIIGLIVGSFINVVAYRTPLIMMNEWQTQISEFICQDANISPAIKTQISKSYQCNQNNQHLSLSLPRSHCPHCQHQLIWWHNIPVVSFLMLSGRCKSCCTAIPPTYLIVEILTALLSLLVALNFGSSIQMVFALILTWFLLALSLIDLKVQLLPDRLLAPLGMIGLLANIHGIFTTPILAMWGLVAGFVSFWLINILFRLIVKKDGMGLGDAKLIAVLGAWLGVEFLPMIVFIGALLGVIFGVFFQKYKQPFAFGPYLALGGLVALLWGEALLAWYLGGLL